MKKKKALALLLTAAMTVGMLAGCGGSDSAATAGNAETAAGPASENPAD